MKKIEKVLQRNKEQFIEQEQRHRMSVYVEKCRLKMRMESVKKMKATKSDKDHGIKKKQPITFDIVLALIFYTQCTKLCTSFRLTYRKLAEDESMKSQKERHSLFANMGRLLFEAFSFYASTDSKVAVLYHGMGVELLF